MSRNTKYFFQARLIDYFVVLFSSLISFFSFKGAIPQFNFENITDVTILIQVYYIILIIVASAGKKRQTLGDVIIKVEQRMFDGTKPSLFLFFFKELYFIFVLQFFIYNGFGLIITIFNFIPFVKIKNLNSKVTPFEFIFKTTHYKMNEIESKKEGI